MFGFSEGAGAKLRPMCVISVDDLNLGIEVVGLMVTTQIGRSDSRRSVTLQDWPEAGLPRRSMVRADRPQAIHVDRIRERIGVLSG